MATVNQLTGYTSTAGSASTKYSWSTNTMNTTNVSDPPTEAEIIAIFGTAASAGSGFVGYIDDNGAGSKIWQVASTGTKWIYWGGTVAV